MYNKKYLLVIAGIICISSVFILKSQLAFLKKTSGIYEERLKEEEEDPSKPSNAFESMQFVNTMRAYPDADIPQDKFYSAYEFSRDRMHQLNTGRSPEPWKTLGPTNIGGRCLSLAIDPIDTSIVYVGSASGGLWKSTTGGIGPVAWSYVETGFPVQAVSAIVINKSNPNIIYIGTGENYGYHASLNGLDNRLTRGMYGMGILKSTNAGASWTKSLDWTYQSRTGIWKILINPKNPSVLYAGTSEGIYRSNDAGSNWTQQLNYKMIVDMEIDPIDTNVVYASVGDLPNISPIPAIGIFKTVDSGNNWSQLTNGLPSSWTGKTTIELYKKNPKIIIASVSNTLSYIGIFKSTDAGISWSPGSTSVPIGNQGWYNNALLIKEDDSSKVFVGTLDVESSSDGGMNFTTVSHWFKWYEGLNGPGEPEGPPDYIHADLHNFSTNPKDNNKIYIVNDGGVYRTNDFGKTFYACNGGLVTSQFYNSFANSYQDSNFAIGGLQDNRAAIYMGYSNNAFYKTFAGDGFWSGINSVNDSIMYTEYTCGSFFKSTDRGNVWNQVGFPNGGNSNIFCFSTPFLVCKADPSVIYGGGNGVYKSTDGGTVWDGPFGNSEMSGMKVLSMAVSDKSTDTLYCGTAGGSPLPGGVFRSFNGGINWENISGNLPINNYAIDMNVNQNNVKEVFITYGGFGNGHVFRSTNAGTNWTDISAGLPDVPTESVVSDPLYPSNIYVGNDIGVYVSTNSGSTWNLFSTGMHTALVFDLSISYPNRKLRAATYGSGIWERPLVQNPVSVGNISSNIPEGYKLYQNFPNPFNPSTNIRFDVKNNSNVKITVYNSQGKIVDELVNKQLKSGTYEIMWNASSHASGIYFYQLESEGRIIESKKMLLVK